MQLVKLTGFLHPVVKKALANQACPSREAEGKVGLEECSHTGHFRSKKNVQKSVEILGEAAGSQSDGVVGQLPMGVGRTVMCERCGRVNSFSEQVLNYASSHQLFWLVSAELYSWGMEKLKRNPKQALFIMKL